MTSSETYSVLQKYDLLVFPTFYRGEGLPGAIVDAFISGVPVLASDWHCNSELIVDGETGYIFKVLSTSDLVEKIKRFIDCPDMIMEMREKCISKANDYQTKRALRKLLQDISAGRENKPSKDDVQ